MWSLTTTVGKGPDVKNKKKIDGAIKTFCQALGLAVVDKKHLFAYVSHLQEGGWWDLNRINAIKELGWVNMNRVHVGRDMR